MTTKGQMKNNSTTPGARVNAYLAALPTHARRKLRALRAAVQSAAPNAVESAANPGHSE
ncbi:MAG: hypothetical protein ABJC89_07845 [Acidobacteriota bacterium]